MRRARVEDQKMPASAFGKDSGPASGVYLDTDRHLRRRQPPGGKLAHGQARNTAPAQDTQGQGRRGRDRDDPDPHGGCPTERYFPDSCAAPRPLGKLWTSSLDENVATIGPELGAALAGIEASKLDALLAGLLAKSEAKVSGAWLPALDVVDDVFAGRVMDLYKCLARR